MRTYEELVQEFSSRGQEEKQKWIDELPIEEIKVLINGLTNVAYTGIWDSWIEYMEMIILIKIELEREKKLKEIGI
jgi:hypothetical protein